MKQTLFILCMMLGLISCGQPIGKSSNVIKFSKTKLSFDAQGGTETITSVGSGWWIIGLSVDDDKYLIERDENGDWYLYEKTEDGKYEKLDTSEVVVGPNKWDDIINIKGPWFTIDKETSQKITFSVLPNDTGKDRILFLSVEDGNYFTSIMVNQSAD